jgi:hypothetical protein
MHKQAVLAILVIEQHEIADIFRIFAWRKFRMPDLGGVRIFKPIFRNVIGGRENNSCTGRIDRFPVTVPILEDARIVVILPCLPIHINEVAREIIRVCSDAQRLHLGIAQRHALMVRIEIVSLSDENLSVQRQNECSFAFICAWTDSELLPEIAVVRQSMPVSLSLLLGRFAQ